MLVIRPEFESRPVEKKLDLLKLISLPKAKLITKIRTSEENENMIRLLMDLLSHDIRNYSSTTIGWIDFLESRLTSPEEAQNIYSDIKRIQFESVSLVENVLNLNKIQERVLLPEEVSLAECFSQSVKKTMKAYPRISLAIKNEDSLNGHMVNAHSLLIEIFFNLLTNAIKYKKTEANTVTIELDVNIENNHINLYLADNGKGIPESMKSILFQRKTIGDAREGLGLYIITQILDYFNCEIQVRNRIDSPNDHTTGTLFILSFPS
jgi:K+-sensing histidine kinase KdpD